MSARHICFLTTHLLTIWGEKTRWHDMQTSHCVNCSNITTRGSPVWETSRLFNPSRSWSNLSRSSRRRWSVNRPVSWWLRHYSRWPGPQTWAKVKLWVRMGPQRMSLARFLMASLTVLFSFWLTSKIACSTFPPRLNIFMLPLDLFLSYFLELPPVVHVVSTKEQDWTEQEVSVESSPTIIYQEVSSGESQSATSTIKALLELQQTTGWPLCCRCTGNVMWSRQQELQSCLTF